MPLWAIGIACLACLSVLYMRKKRKYTIASLRKVAVLVQHVDIDLNDRDIINSQFIGIDVSKKMLVLSQLNHPAEPVRTIMLSDIVFCRMIKKYREILSTDPVKATGENELDHVSIVFYSGAKYPEAEFTFYDGSLNTKDEMPGMIKKAEYWKNLIAKTGSVDIL